MPDFLISLDPHMDSDRLLELLKKPYGTNPPEGISHQYPWGTIALLHDQVAGNENVLSANGLTFGWAGELLFAGGQSKALDGLSQLSLFHSAEFLSCLKKCGFLERLNGAYAAFFAGKEMVAVVTDPMASVQLYCGRDGSGRIVALGTHPDLVALISSEQLNIDPVSVSDFLNTGIACCPHTMHGHVKEIAPGTVLSLAATEHHSLAESQFHYWLPPEELDAPDERALVAEFVENWRKAVVARCGPGPVAVQLSGGMDSRLVLACVPTDLECVGVTLCDSINREARFARRVAACYNRKWVTLDRDPEYLARTAPQAIGFTGCEGEWHHGHSVGFAAQLKELGVNSVFTGLLMDNNFKGYYARDIKRVSRFGGLLPAEFKRVPVDYSNEVSSFCRGQLQSSCLQGIVDRRKDFSKNHFALGRESACEWLDGYPYSQACDNTGWVIERRVMPMRLPLMDRSLLDLAFRLPVRLKAGGRFFDQAATEILGPKGRSIPSANDGVRPGSNHVSRLLQRAVRKVENESRGLASKLGFRLPVPHSWHDFHHYLNTSPMFGEFFARHGNRLLEFEGSVFRSNPTTLWRNPAVPWNVGYRLIQLAIWRNTLDEYRK